MVYFFTKLFQGVVWSVITIFQGFVWYIDVCDAVVTTGLIWLYFHKKLGWNIWWALAFALLVSLILYIIFKHRIGFWIVAPIFSLFWAWIFSALVQAAFPTMPELLFWIVAIASFAWNIWAHDYARDRVASIARVKAEDAEQKRQAEEDYQNGL